MVKKMIEGIIITMVMEDKVEIGEIDNKITMGIRMMGTEEMKTIEIIEIIRDMDKTITDKETTSMLKIKTRSKEATG